MYMTYMYIPGTCFSSILGFERSKKKAFSIQNRGHLGSRYMSFNSTSPKANPTIFGPKDSFADICWHARSSVERGHTPHPSAGDEGD